MIWTVGGVCLKYNTKGYLMECTKPIPFQALWTVQGKGEEEILLQETKRLGHPR